jgi:hypothetical protein
VISGLAPALAIIGVSFGFASHYGEPVSDYLKQTEREFLAYAKSRENNDESSRSLRNWTNELHSAHAYRDAYGRCVKVAWAGAFGWFVAYIARIGGVGSFIFNSPFGAPPSFGIQIMAVLALGIATYDGIRIVNKFGVRPEEVVTEEVGEYVEAE